MKKYSVAFFILFSFLQGKCQRDSIIFVNEHGEVSKNIFLSIKPNLDLQQSLIALKNTNIENGFFQFSIDSIFAEGNEKKIHYFQGPKYQFSNLVIDDLDQAISPRAAKRQMRSNTPHQLIVDALMALENSGYPFAEIEVEQIVIVDSVYQVSLKTIPNRLVKIDSIVIQSQSTIENALISKLINIKPGDVYSENAVGNIDKYIKNSDLFTVTKKTEVLFVENGARIYLYLEKKASNKFDGVIGFQSTAKNAKIGVTGSLDFKLENNFQRGEKLAFNWEKLPSQTQNLTLEASYPYVLFSNVGVSGSLSIYRQDSSFISTVKKIGSSYRFSKNEEVGVFVESFNSFNQQMQNEASFNSGAVKSVGSGVYFSKRKFDQLVSPKKGYFIFCSYSIGNRQRQGGDSQKQTQHRSKAGVVKITPLYKGLNLFIKLQEQFQTASGQLNSEMIRFGGRQSIRGFDELSLRATTVILGTVSLRYFIDNSTNIHLFYDQAWYERNAKNEYLNDYPFGIGAGFSFLSNNGVFTFSYALGSQFENPINVRSGKVHFGYVSIF